MVSRFVLQTQYNSSVVQTYIVENLKMESNILIFIKH